MVSVSLRKRFLMVHLKLHGMCGQILVPTVALTLLTADYTFSQCTLTNMLVRTGLFFTVHYK